MPSDWRTTRLGDLVTSIEYGSSAKSARTGLVPVLRMGNVQGGRIDWTDLVYSDDKAECAKYALASGDVLFNRTNTIDLVGKTSIYSGEREALFAGYLIRIRVNRSLLDARFLNYFMNTEAARRHSAKVLSVAVGQANINGQKLRTYPIPLPPALAEQRAIAEALSDADAFIGSLVQLLAKKRLIKHGVMQELLTGKTRLPGFDAEWESASIGALFEFSGGYTASRDQLSSQGHCYLHYGDIHSSTQTYIDLETEHDAIPKLDVSLSKVSPSSLLQDGDIVFVDASDDDDGTSRHVVIVNPEQRPFIAGLHTIVASGARGRLAHEFRRFCFQIEAVKHQFRFFAVGTKVSGISKSNIAKVVVRFPSLPEQIEIARVLADIDSELIALESKLTKARQINQGMMQELLTGRIRLI